MDTRGFAAKRCRQLLYHNVPRGGWLRKIEYTDLEVEVEGTVDKTQTGYCFTRIVIRPRLMISDEQEQTWASDLLKQTKSLCLVARAVATTQEFEPRVGVGRMV